MTVKKKKRWSWKRYLAEWRPSGGWWGWMVVLGAFLMHVICDGIVYAFGLFFEEFLDTFDEGASLTSWIASVLVGCMLGSGFASILVVLFSNLYFFCRSYCRCFGQPFWMSCRGNRRLNYCRVGQCCYVFCDECHLSDFVGWCLYG